MKIKYLIPLLLFAFVIGASAYTVTSAIFDSFHLSDSISSNKINPIQITDTFNIKDSLNALVQNIVTTITNTMTVTLNTISCNNCFTYTGDAFSTFLTVYAYPIIIVIIVLLVSAKYGIAGTGISFVIALTTTLLMASFSIIPAWTVLLTVVGLAGGLAYTIRRVMLADN